MQPHMTPTSDAIRPSEFIERDGVGDRGQQLIDAVGTMFDDDFRAMQAIPENEELTRALTREDRLRASKIIGYDPKGLALRVRGVEFDDPIVSYAAIEGGEVRKGYFRYEALKDPDAEVGHFSQYGAVNDSDVAARLREQREKASQADAVPAADVAALRERAEAAEKALADAQANADAGKAPAPAEDPEPFKGYDKLTVPQVRAGVEKSKREVVVEILAYEQRNENRKGVVQAALERITELDSAKKDEALEERDAEIRRLQEKLAEAEEAATRPQADATDAQANADGGTTPEAPAA